MPIAANDDLGLSHSRIQELADWYEQGYQRSRDDGELDSTELDNDLRLILREETPQRVEDEFDRIMKIVFTM